jgi:uncharacterized membrane protein YdbT with pleckstrin-like domain
MGLAADAQRERTVTTLRRAYLDGRLRDDELAERTGRALAARTTGELRSLVRDLPVLAELAADVRTFALRAARLAIVGMVWLVGSAILLVAFVAALLPGWLSATESLVFPLLWVLLTIGAWRAGRQRPSPRP